MDAVHAWCDKDQIQNPLDADWQSPVGMMKQCGRLECNKKDDQHDWPNSEQDRCQREKTDGKNHFAEVKSRGGAHIEIEIGVMHVMKSPKDRDHVHGPVPPPVGVVHQKECCDHDRPGWKMQPIQ